MKIYKKIPNHSALNSTFLSLIIVLSHQLVFANGAGTSGALTLKEVTGARAASMGEAFSAAADDITAFGYNPASLKSLTAAQASFFYRTGIADDSFGQFAIGSPLKKSSLAISIGYFNGGKLDLFDGTNQRSAVVQRDLTAAFGYSFNIGKMNVGVTGKYLSSELVEQKTATAYAADAGFQIPIHDRVRLGAAIQNFGTKLKFDEVGDELPQTFRGGLSWLIVPGANPARMMIDGVYDINESQFVPAIGAEKSFGLLSLRVGYKGMNGLHQFSAGAGFMISRFSFDYSFGLVDQLDSTHMLSLSMRFDPPFLKETALSQKIEKPVDYDLMRISSQKEKITGWEKMGKKSRVYTVKEGDTLAKIALHQYGRKSLWKIIYNANSHFLRDPESLETGQKLYIPNQY